MQTDEGTPSWRRFSELLNLRYGPSFRSNPMAELMECRRTTTVAEYQDRFEALLPRVGPLDERKRVQAFTAGLGPPLSIDVQVQNPQTLILAMNLARTLEQQDKYYALPARISVSASGPATFKPAARGLLPGAPQPLALPAPPSSATGAPAIIEGRHLRRLSQAEMESRKRLGLCFNCDEKFERGHNRVCKRVFLLELSEEDEAEDFAATEAEDPRISLLAMAGVRTCDTMQVCIRMGDTELLALLDSGSTHNFISEDAAARTALCLQPHGSMRVTVANGDRVPCPRVYRAARFSVADEQFQADLFALPLAGYDVVLGTEWLAALGPIL